MLVFVCVVFCWLSLCRVCVWFLQVLFVETVFCVDACVCGVMCVWCVMCEM